MSPIWAHQTWRFTPEGNFSAGIPRSKSWRPITTRGGIRERRTEPRGSNAKRPGDNGRKPVPQAKSKAQTRMNDTRNALKIQEPSTGRLPVCCACSSSRVQFELTGEGHAWIAAGGCGSARMGPQAPENRPSSKTWEQLFHFAGQQGASEATDSRLRNP